MSGKGKFDFSDVDLIEAVVEDVPELTPSSESSEHVKEEETNIKEKEEIRVAEVTGSFFESHYERYALRVLLSFIVVGLFAFIISLIA